MKELFTGIMTYFNADDTDDFYVAITGRLYSYEAPQPTTYPYAVFFMVSDVPDWLFGAEVQENIPIQFNLFSDKNSGVEINDMYTHLKARFDNCALTVSGYRHIEFRRTFAQLLRDAERAVWQYAVEYDVIIEK